MNGPALTREQWIEVDRVVRRFGAANRVSIVVGLVLTPLLFGGVGAGLWAVIPAPFGAWVGGSILGAGAMMLLFLLWYRHRTLSRPAFAAQATIVRWIAQTGRHGDETFAVEVAIGEAHTVGHDGLGQSLPKLSSLSKTLRLTSKRLYEVVPVGQPVLLLCMPTEEVVAVLRGTELVIA